MGSVHIMVNDICTLYAKRMRRFVYVTPKSFLSFIGFYKDLYLLKFDESETKSNSYRIGLEKIAEATKEINMMGQKLKIKQVELKKAADKTEKFVEKLKRESAKAEKKKREVKKTTKECEFQTLEIGKERKIAHEELADAMPALIRAE